MKGRERKEVDGTPPSGQRGKCRLAELSEYFMSSSSLYGTENLPQVEQSRLPMKHPMMHCTRVSHPILQEMTLCCDSSGLNFYKQQQCATSTSQTHSLAVGSPSSGSVLP